MAGYTKLWSDIVDSSIWQEPPEICKVWITLLALSDAHGFVRGSLGWLAAKAHVDRGVCATAISLFTNTDPSSRTEHDEGRRVEQLENGWLILNYEEFRNRLSTDPEAIAVRERVRKFRAKDKEGVTSVT